MNKRIVPWLKGVLTIVLAPQAQLATLAGQ